MRCKNVVILGSTGSIGINTLKVIERFPQRFKVVGLTAYNNCRLLEQQVRKFSPSHVGVGARGIDYLKKHISTRKTRVSDVNSGAENLVSLKSVDIVVVAMPGSAALKPFLAAVRAGKTVAAANKEAIVIAGDILMREAQRHHARLIPIDSEQSAIFQCLDGRDQSQLRKVYLTASGGALLKVPKSRFDSLSVDEILRHPRWKMGKRITVDSATLMNKGFEIIETSHLFQLNIDEIQVVVHPEALIHSMVEFKDGSVIAQLGVTDMRLPIQYALTYPQRLDTGLQGMDFSRIKQMTFQRPDFRKFPSLALAIHAARQGGTGPSVLNAVDEVAVDAFLNQRLKFTQIYKVVEKVLMRHKITQNPSFQEILEADQWAREEALKFIRH